MLEIKGDSIKEQQLIVVLSSLFLRQLRQMDWFSGENRPSISEQNIDHMIPQFPLIVREKRREQGKKAGEMKVVV